MPTRRQSQEQPQFRQDAFASSAEYERGILGNLVAARCHRITDPAEIAMLWWLQQISWRDGGLESFAEGFLAENQQRVGTPSMFKFGVAPGRKYSAREVRIARREFPDPSLFLLKGEVAGDVQNDFCDLRSLLASNKDASWNARERAQSAAFPESYPSEKFADASRLEPEALATEIKRRLVDPSSDSLRAGLWNFPALWDALVEWRAREVEDATGRIVKTEITRQVEEELDFAFESKSFVLIEGREGIGKSEAACQWCDQHPGRAIYVRLEAGSDETTLYRSIARRIGTACSYQRKAVEMRARIQDALQNGNLMLVLDEAHFLWPQSHRGERSVPKRMDWVRTALVDFGVPVAMISTPQYFARQCDRYRKAGWNANQVQRRLARTVTLPERISSADLLAVAKSYFPKAPKRLLVIAAAASQLSVARLTMFSHLAKRVSFLAVRNPGADETAMLEAALVEINAPGLAAIKGDDSAAGSDRSGTPRERHDAPVPARIASRYQPARSAAPVADEEPEAALCAALCSPTQ